MSREYNISWNANQLKRLNSAVRKYNNAIRRAARKDPVAAQFLPKEVKYKDIKSQIRTARELNVKVNSLLRATAPGAMDFVKQGASFITRYERREFSILKGVRERKKARELRSRADEFRKMRYMGIEEASLQPDKRSIDSLEPKTMRRFIETQSRLLYEPRFVTGRKWMRNYKMALDEEFGSFGMFAGQVAQIKELMDAVDASMAAEIIRLVPNIEFTYSMLDKDYKLSQILDAWEEVAANERFAR